MYRVLTAAVVSAVPFAALAMPSAPAVVGPGGVIIAVDALVRAIDAGDPKALQAVCTAADRGYTARITEDGGIQEVETGAEHLFVDVDAAGQVVARADATAFAKVFLDAVRADGDGPRLLGTEITALRADCASQAASWAVVDLVRRYGSGEGAERPIPLRATALLRYQSGGFQVFHWHVSRR